MKKPKLPGMRWEFCGMFFDDTEEGRAKLAEYKKRNHIMWNILYVTFVFTFVSIMIIFFLHGNK